MAQVDLTSRRSAAVVAVKRLHTKAGRKDSQTFLIEGPQALREAFSHRADIRQVYVTSDAVARWAEIMQAARAAEVEITIVSDSVLEAMAETKSPQGWLATCRMEISTLEEIFSARPQVLVALDQVSDPGNVGTIIRTADAAGANAVLLTGESVDPFNGKCVRASAGSIFHLPVVPELSVEQLVAVARQQGTGIAVTSATGECDLFEWLDSAPVMNPTMWVFGSEAHGVSAELYEAADVRVRIPIHGAAESLNIASAVAVCLYADVDRRRARLT
ncbi:MAG: RNA methyltransferase [Candidatus Nanopelagicales bacterium]|nr:RNA methyltransferase [Candidatus Nanopelagicales bacterium]